MNSQIKEIAETIKGSKDKIAFLIGNGINRYNQRKDDGAWIDILRKLWTIYAPGGIPFPMKGETSDISFIELFDVIRSFKKTQKKPEVLETMIKEMKKWEPAEHHKKIMGKVRSLKAPVLTTNFDLVLSKAVGAEFVKNPKGKKGFSYRYPWESYFACEELKKGLKGFAVWNIHGSIRYKNSIRLGLSDYMGMVARARNLIWHKQGLYGSQRIRHWEGKNTWLDIFFRRRLFIFGLGLSREEIFLRWLLIQRRTFHKSHNKRMMKGWYVHVENKRPINDGKRIFLDSMGIKILSVPAYDALYDSLWDRI